MAIIGVGIYSVEAGGYNVFDFQARDMYHNNHSEATCVLLEIPSMHKFVQYFQTLHRNEDICIYIYVSTQRCTYRGGSRGRVQGVRTPPPPPEMTCGFQLVFCKKKLCGLLVLK